MKLSRVKIAPAAAAVVAVSVAVAAVAVAAVVTVVIAAAAAAAAVAAIAAIANPGGKRLSLSPRVISVATLQQGAIETGSSHDKKQCDDLKQDRRAIKEFMTFSQLGLAPAQVRS